MGNLCSNIIHLTTGKERTCNVASLVHENQVHNMGASLYTDGPETTLSPLLLEIDK